MLRKIKVEDSLGEKLLHDITAITPDGFKGVAFKRGHEVTPSDIKKLKEIGEDHVYVGELPTGYVHEEDAAKVLADVVIGDNVYLDGPSEGKIGLYADIDGMLVIDSDGLYSINSVGDFTLATKKNYITVSKGDYICGLRIVPLYTTEDIVDSAVSFAKENYPVIDVHPYKKLKVGTIITGTEIYEGIIEDKFEAVLREKLGQYSVDILGFKKAPDNLEYLDSLVDEYLKLGADLILMTGGMSVDPDDLTPTAIKNTGAEMIIQGIPVQPGNMLTIGKLENTYLVGVPGASINSPYTSFDDILPRIFAGVELKRSDLVRMGEGGLY